MTEKHQLLTDQQFEEKFKACKLPPVVMTHEAHLRLAYIHLKKYGLKKTVKTLTEQISRFYLDLGDASKFNKTITVASIKLLNQCIKKAKTSDFRSFVNEYPKLKENFLSLIKKHYTIDIVNSYKAKRQFIQPDMPFGVSA